MASPLGAIRPAATPADDRRDPEVRRRLSGPALRTFFNIARAWQLTPTEERGLLGWPPASTFYKHKGGASGTLSLDTLTRISLVLGIYKALHVLYPEERFADAWVKLPNSNPLFGGRPPIELMVEGGIDGLHRTRRLLDGRLAG